MDKKQLLKALEENVIVCMEGTPKDKAFSETDKVKFKISTLKSGYAPFNMYTNDERLYNTIRSGKRAHTAYINMVFLKEIMSKYRISIYDLQDIINSFKDLIIL